MNELVDEIYLSCFRVDWFASQWHYTSICSPFGIYALWRCLWEEASVVLLT